VAGEDRSVSGLAGRYVAALFDLADEQKALDQVAGDLTGLRTAIEGSPELRRLMRSPLYGRDQQVKAMDAVLAKSGVADLTRKFVLVVAQNRRLFALSGMIDAFLAELARRRGEVTAKVTVARPLTAAQTQRLEETLRASVGGKVRIDTKIDESLIGGLIVQVGSRMVDGSLKTKLQKLQNAMKGV
jgi:F-type H+-transporting ATPase subunit delta